ncbi:hypothetical protein [Plesiocystis pacifica]|nr:hypothetical protein [Plesiocystis pacifica]
MRARGLVLAFLFIVVVGVLAWLTGDRSPLAKGPESLDSASE